MLLVNELQVDEILEYPALIHALDQAFQEEYTVPMRHHHYFENPKADQESTLLLMPAWQKGQYLGIKNVIVSPGNQQFELPAIQGVYLLFDANTGVPLLQCDARTLTKKRTAAASALAASYLARPDSNSMLMVGTGALAPELIRAHRSIFPLKKIWIWGRRYQMAQPLAKELESELDLEIQAVKDIAEVASKADLISAATLSPNPLILGEWLRPGQHIDLVGSYRPDTREADDQVIRLAQVFVDTMAGATKESGDILIPIQKGILSEKDIRGDLFGLCRKEKQGRTHPEQITVFKSVGHALEDLAAAQLLYQHLV